MVGRERRLSLSLVRRETLAQAAQGLPTDGGSVGGGGTGGARLETTGETSGGDKRQPLRQERLQYNTLEIRSASLVGVFSRLDVRVVQTTIV